MTKDMIPTSFDDLTEGELDLLNALITDGIADNKRRAAVEGSRLDDALRSIAAELLHLRRAVNAARDRRTRGETAVVTAPKEPLRPAFKAYDAMVLIDFIKLNRRRLEHFCRTQRDIAKDEVSDYVTGLVEGIRNA